MKRGWFLGIAILLLGVIAALAAAPATIESRFNHVSRAHLPAPSTQAVTLHSQLGIADMHADTLLWARDLTHRSSRGHVDLPRLEDGNVALQIFSSVTKTPRGLNYHSNSADSDQVTLLSVAQLQPPRTWSSLLERSLWHANKLRRGEVRSDGRLRIIRSSADVRKLLADQAAGRRVTGAMLSIEGLHNLEGKLGNLQRLREAGYRMAGLTHFFDNELAGSMHGERKGGLTPFGRQVIEEMERRRMIVDVAHASSKTINEMLAITTQPVVYSHRGVQATCTGERNLSDDQVRAIAAKGGLIGIGYWDAAVCSSEPRAIAAAIAHVRDLVGIEHVALGSDFDGAVTTPFDTSQLVHVTDALLQHGFSGEEIANVMGGNLLTFLERHLPSR